MGNALYRKEGGRFRRVPAHERWLEGRPAEGIWIVQRGGNGKALMCRVGEVPDAVPLACLWAHKDAACSAVLALKGNVSVSDIVDAVFKAIVTPAAEEDRAC